MMMMLIIWTNISLNLIPGDYWASDDAYDDLEQSVQRFELKFEFGDDDDDDMYIMMKCVLVRV